MQPIFHLALRADWQAALDAGTGEYRISTRGLTLEQQGFIHCSTAEQVPRIAEFHYRGHDVVLLRIDPAAVTPEIVFENLEGGTELFPHIYGPLSLGAVVGVAPYIEGDGGSPKVDDAFLAANFGAVFPGPTKTLVEVAATVLRNEQGHILTVRKRGTSRFMFPGGKPEPGEPFLQTALREASEEVGAEHRPEDYEFRGIFVAPAANEPELMCREYLYEAREPFTEPVIAGEIEAFRWVDPAGPLPEDIAPLVRLIISQVG